jgi:creatinine amidohydrolase
MERITRINYRKDSFFLTIAPIEEHSHHLPLGVGIILGEYWNEKIIQLSGKYKDFYFLSMPPIPFADGSIKGFPGNLQLKHKTVFHVSYEIIKKYITGVFKIL